MASAFKTLTLKPLLTALDTRSAIDDVPSGSFRMKLNLMVTEDRKLCRRPGHRRLMADADLPNSDWHDQGDCSTSAPLREAAYLLRETTDAHGTRRLVLGKRDQLAVLNTNLGTWTPLMQGGIFGGSSTSAARWQMITLGNYAMFTNDFDAPVYCRLGAQPSICGETLVQQVPDLRDTIQLSQAGVIATFNGTVFLMDTLEEGGRHPSRVRWSALNSVLLWTATLDALGVPSNISGYQDLPYGERIIAAKELAGNLYIFTETSIWRCYVAGGTGVYGFSLLYSEPRNRAGCLTYPNTLVSTGDNLFYFGSDGIYRFNAYQPAPVRDEWLHRANGLMFSELDPACCDGPVGEVYPDRSEIWWSYALPGESCANGRTFVANYLANTADYVDHGYSAFANWRPDTRQTLDEWLDQYCTSDFAGMCAALGNSVSDDFCNECNTSQLFVGASTEDLCLKELGGAYSRERCTNAATGHGATGVGGVYVPFTATYALDGYFSLMRGLFPLGYYDAEKVVRRFLLDNSAGFQLETVPDLRLRLGTSYKALDANPSGNPFAFGYAYDNDFAAAVAPFYTVPGNACQVVWIPSGDDLPLDCFDTADAQQHADAFTRDGGPATEWATYAQGRFLNFEAIIVGKDETGSVVPPTGGSVCFSRIEVEARVV